jgi:hypothetical protein
VEAILDAHYLGRDAQLAAAAPREARWRTFAGWAQLQRSEFSPNDRVRVLACFALNLAVA